MAKEKINLRNELREYKFDFDLLQKIPCSKEENQSYAKLIKDGQPLPNGVYRYKDGDGKETDSFYTVYESDLTPEETAQFLTLKKLRMLKTIKNCVVFFTVLTVISIAAYIITLLANM